MFIRVHKNFLTKYRASKVKVFSLKKEQFHMYWQGGFEVLQRENLCRYFNTFQRLWAWSPVVWDSLLIKHLVIQF